MKRYFLALFLVVVMIVLFSGFADASLGISPAKKEYNFIPNGEINVNFLIFTDDPERKISLFIDGDLAQYARLSKRSLTGGGGFTVTINFPADVGKPGRQSIGIRAEEQVSSEESFFSTTINVGSVIYIFVPYPGRYAETILNIPDGNVDEEIPIEALVINRGEEALDVDVAINFFEESGSKVYTMNFQEAIIGEGQERYFRKFLDTTGYRPGSYLAEAVVSYGPGEETRVNKTFRIGSLFVNITNFTESLPKKGIQKFVISVESRWNGNLEGIFADVNLTNELDEITFRTPSLDLGPWEAGTLVGFLDTGELEGQYEVDVVVNYVGQQTFASGLLTIREFNVVLIAGVVIAVIIILIVVFIVWRFKIRKKRK
jgi:hypothetical protein